MVRKLKKIMFFRLEDKKLAILSAACFIILMLPIIYLGKYDAPHGDDYGYSKLTHQVWDSTHNFFTVLQVAFVQARISWHTWQGTFSSIFMMALCPFLFNYRLYKLVPAFIIFSMSLSCFVVSKLLLRDILKCKNGFWVTIGAAMSILTIEKMYTIPSGLFWYNAAVHYMFMQSMMFLMIVNVIRMVRTEKKASRFGYLILSSIMAVGAGGSNYATSVMGIVLLVGVSLLLWLVYKKKALFCLIPFFCFLTALLINVIAPGNAVRAENYVGWGLSPAKSILMSFYGAAELCGIWIGNFFVILLLLLLIPVFCYGLRDCAFRFPVPGVVLLASFCFLATGLTSSYYSLGYSGLSRLQNAVCMTFHILLILNEGYLIGWIQRKRKNGLSLNLLYFAGILVSMWASILLSENPVGTFATYGSVYYLKTKDAALHYQEFMERKEQLESGIDKDVVLKPYRFQPWYLSMPNDEPTEDENFYINVYLSEYYGNHSVVVKE